VVVDLVATTRYQVPAASADPAVARNVVMSLPKSKRPAASIHTMRSALDAAPLDWVLVAPITTPSSTEGLIHAISV